MTGRFRHRVLKHGVGVEWDARRTAAEVPCHFNGFYPTPSTDIWWPRAVLHQVTLTFGEPLDQADIQSDIPPVDAFGDQEQYCQVSLTFAKPLGQDDLQSDVSLTFGEALGQADIQ